MVIPAGYIPNAIPDDMGGSEVERSAPDRENLPGRDLIGVHRSVVVPAVEGEDMVKNRGRA